MKIKSNLILIILFTAISLVSGCTKQMYVLIEKDEIVDTINRLFIYTDSMEWEKVKQVFTDKVMFSMGGSEPSSRTADQIVDAWDKSLKRLKAVHHQSGNYRVSVNGIEADAFCYGVTIHYLPNSSGGNTRTFVGSYEFHLIKSDGVWKIDEFKFDLKFIEGNRTL